MTKYNKFWVVLITVGANFVQQYWGIDLGVDQAAATTLVNVAGAALVWLVPNA